jgi:hypothetical protein
VESPRRSCQQEETHEGAPDQLPPQLLAPLLPLGPWLPLPNWGEAAARVAAASEEAAMAYFMVAVLICCCE